MSKSSDVRKVKTLSNKLVLYYSYVQDDSVEIFAHGIYEDVFIMCTRENLSDTWVINFIVNKTLSHEEIYCISTLIKYTLRLEVNFHSKIKFGNQSQVFPNKDTSVRISSDKIKFVSKMYDSKLELVFASLIQKHLQIFIQQFTLMRRYTLLFKEAYQRNILNDEMVDLLLFLGVIDTAKERTCNLSLHFKKLSQCKALIDFILRIYSDNYYLTKIFMDTQRLRQAIDFHKRCDFKFKGTAMFPGSRVRIKQRFLWDGKSELGIYFGQLFVSSISTDYINIYYSRDPVPMQQFNFMLNLLYKDVGKDKVDDVLMKNKLLVS